MIAVDLQLPTNHISTISTTTTTSTTTTNMTKPADISQLKTTTVKTTTATLLRPRALKNSNDVLEVHLPTLMSSFISQNSGFRNGMRSPIMLTGDLPTIKNPQFVEEIIPNRSRNQFCLDYTHFIFFNIVNDLHVFKLHLSIQIRSSHSDFDGADSSRKVKPI